MLLSLMNVMHYRLCCSCILQWAWASKFSLFVDDLKPRRIVKSVRDCNALQAGIVALQLWGEYKGLKLSMGKCKVMSLFRKRDLLFYEYEMDDSRLGRVSSSRRLCASISM